MQESKTNKPTFAIVGLGFISPRHIQAIEDLDGEIIGACDVDEEKKYKAGDAPFFKDYNKMLESFECVDYVVIATPNYLHKEMIEKAYNKVNKGIICEKPLCLSMAELDALEKYRDKIFPVMQLRYSDKLKREREKIKLIDVETIDMEICVRRDDWYFEGWKGDKDKAGKLLYNIGIHYIDILQWFFGRLNDSKIIREEEKIIECMLRFQGGTVKFILDLTAPMDNQRRLLKVNDYVIDLSKGFENMHKKVYENVLSDNPINLEEVYKDIMIIEKIYGNS